AKRPTVGGPLTTRLAKRPTVGGPLATGFSLAHRRWATHHQARQAAHCRWATRFWVLTGPPSVGHSLPGSHWPTVGGPLTTRLAKRPTVGGPLASGFSLAHRRWATRYRVLTGPPSVGHSPPGSPSGPLSVGHSPPGSPGGPLSVGHSLLASHWPTVGGPLATGFSLAHRRWATLVTTRSEPRVAPGPACRDPVERSSAAHR